MRPEREREKILLWWGRLTFIKRVRTSAFSDRGKARLQAGYKLSDRERDAVARHLARLRDNSAAALHGARLLGLGPDDSQGAVGDSGSGVTAGG
jgi:hypothetical protein